MKFQSSVIFVNDIKLSKMFYSDVLNMTIEHDFGASITFHGGLSIWQLSKNHIICHKLDTKAPNNRLELYFEDSNLKSISAKLKTQEIELLHDIQEEPWGQRTIRFFDPDNHLIEIAEPLPTFIKNLALKGLNSHEIASKSGVNIELVKSMIEA